MKPTGWIAGIAAAASVLATAAPENTHAVAPSLPSSLYEEWRLSPSPAPGSGALANPPSLQWASVKHWDDRDVRYRVQISDDATFPAARTTAGKWQRPCFFNPHKKFAPGTWYWRYEIQDGTNSVVKGPYSFVIDSATPVFETPDFDAFLAGIPGGHPRVITQGRDLTAIRKSAATHPLAVEIVRQGRNAAGADIYDGPVVDTTNDPARARALDRKGSSEVALFHALVDGYILSGDKAMRAALLKRIELLLKWPTDDLLGSQVLTALSKAYDALYDELPAAVRARMLTVIEGQLRRGLAAWPGNIEGRQVQNHFWQMELAGNFTAALATVHDLEASREMLEYTYELYLARFPNLATPDGGWAEGLGYFGVNKSAVVDMAVLMKKVGHVDPFKMQWYQSLADYFIYFAPIGGRIDGFGDQHDRVGNGDIGQSMMFVLGQESGDAKALFRAAALAKSSPTVESWYRVVNDINFDPALVSRPASLPQARMFRGVGLAAFHTDVLDSSRDTALYFRSCPFGAKGHMHANQNAFNLSRRGEPLFYSSGYYTSFADAHSMSSFRHTRAHNAILVNGCGQAFGHEGYGWIKRYAHGDRISYVCGDATMAYRPTVDRQFLSMLAESKIQPTPEQGHGDAKLKLFERHVMLLRPDTVVVYDVLESEVESDWTLLLHTIKPSVLDPQHLLHLDTEKNRATAYVTGSQPLDAKLTDQFYSPAVDILKKYRELPNQFHASYGSQAKSKGMRFLTILQMSDPGGAIPPVVAQGRGKFTVGDITIQAELDPGKPAGLSAGHGTAKIFINTWPDAVLGETAPAAVGPSTLLVEKHDGKTSMIVSKDMAPVY